MIHRTFLIHRKDVVLSKLIVTHLFVRLREVTDLDRDGLVVRVGFFVRDRGGIIVNVIGRGKGVVCVDGGRNCEKEK